MPRQVNQEERLREIIFAVWAVIARHGIEAVTMRSVADAASISVGRIQHYFANKEELVYAACEAMVDGAHQQYTTVQAHTGPLETLKILARTAIPTTDHFRVGVAVWYSYLARSIGDPRTAELLRETKHGTYLEAVRLMENAQQLGQIRPEINAESAARQLLMLADGLALAVFLQEMPSLAALEELERFIRQLSQPDTK